MRVKELTLSHENLPGMLASIAKVLGKEKVNILSCLTMTSGTTGTTHLVVDNVENARKALTNSGYATPKQMCSVWSCRIRLERWRSSPASSPKKTSTSFWGIRRASKVRGRRASCSPFPI